MHTCNELQRLASDVDAHNQYNDYKCHDIEFDIVRPLHHVHDIVVVLKRTKLIDNVQRLGSHCGARQYLPNAGGTAKVLLLHAMKPIDPSPLFLSFTLAQ